MTHLEERIQKLEKNLKELESQTTQQTHSLDDIFQTLTKIESTLEK